MNEGFERSQQNNEGSDALASCCGVDLFCQFHRQFSRCDCALKPWGRLACPGRRQPRLARGIVQFLLPPNELLRLRLTVCVIDLVRCVIDVADWQWAQFRRLACAKLLVELAEFLKDDLPRPLVGNNVM